MKRIIFTVYVSCNMLVCALLFMPWALPRETISGLLGRWANTEDGWKEKVGFWGSIIVDRIHMDKLHCELTYRDEQWMRDKFYPENNYD